MLQQSLQKRKNGFRRKREKKPKGGRKKRGGATGRKGVRLSTRRKNGGECSVPGMPDLVDEEELQLSDFEITDDDDDLFASDVPVNKEYMENWWGKFVGEEPHASTGHEDGEEYYDTEELMSLDGSDDELTERKRRRYREFNENHDMRVPIELEKGLLFADTCVFKKGTKMVCCATWVWFQI
jgi:hypothetical protein